MISGFHNRAMSILAALAFVCTAITATANASDVLVYDDFTQQTSSLWNLRGFADPPCRYTIVTSIDTATGDTLRDTTKTDSLHVPYGTTGHGHLIISTQSGTLQYNPVHTGTRHIAGFYGYRSDFARDGLSAPENISVTFLEPVSSVQITNNKYFKTVTDTAGNIDTIIIDTAGIFILIRYVQNGDTLMARSTKRIYKAGTWGLDTLTYVSISSANPAVVGDTLTDTLKTAALKAVTGVGIYYLAGPVYWAAGDYTVRIGGFSAAGTAAGAATILMQPQSRTIVAGDTTEIIATIAGTGPFTYQWSKDTVMLSEATQQNLTFATTLADSGVYIFKLKADDLQGGVETDECTITVAPARDALIREKSNSIVISQGLKVDFRIGYGNVGHGPFTALWYKDGALLTTVQPEVAQYKDYYRTILSFAAVSYDDSGSYYLEVSGRTGVKVISDTIRLTVTEPVPASITTQPLDITLSDYTVDSKGNISPKPQLEVGMNGSNPLSIKWYVYNPDTDKWEQNQSGSSISVTVAESLALSSGQKWFVVVSNPFDTAISDTVTILAMPVSVIRTAVLPKAFSFNSASPNPFVRGTRIEFALPRMQRAECAIYDMKGNLVKTLFRKGTTLNAGTYAATWDGSNEVREAAAPGQYILRLLTADGHKKQVLTLVR